MHTSNIRRVRRQEEAKDYLCGLNTAFMSVRVRFAPSPTGPLHIGGVRTALYNYLFAKHHGGTFLLRIEDTDQGRFVPGAEDYILEALKWCGIEPTEGVGYGGQFGPYRQSERKAMYAQYAEQLVASGNAYYAFDSEEVVSAKRKEAEASGQVWQYDASTRMEMTNSLTMSAEESNMRIAEGNWTIRFKIPENDVVVFTDEIRGEISIQTKVLDDKVLMKSDGMPTYHLANIVDDHLMEITHVIRGEEWLPSAPLHVLLYRAFGWTAPKFAHLPLILKPTGNGKLSKRDGDAGGFPVFPIEWKDPSTGSTSSGYRESGYLPDAVINMLLMLGWNPGTEQEIFTEAEMVALFSLDRVIKSGARFNPDKTKWYNEHYLRNKSPEELTPELQETLKLRGIAVEDSFATGVCKLMLERVTFVKDMADATYFFDAPGSYDEKVVNKRWKEESDAQMLALSDMLAGLTDFSESAVDTAFHAFLEEKAFSAGAIMPVFRLLVTGLGGGPSMFAISELLGKEEVVKRIEKGIAALK
jgi:glutamyl-tRNA synthetase